MGTGQADMGNQQGNRQGRPGKVTGEVTGNRGASTETGGNWQRPHKTRD